MTLPLALSDQRALLVFCEDQNVAASLNAESDRLANDINAAVGERQLVVRVHALHATAVDAALASVLYEAMDRIQTLSEEVGELRRDARP